MRLAGFSLHRSIAETFMVTHWGDSWLYGGMVCFRGWALSFPGWPPRIRREEARARQVLHGDYAVVREVK